MGEGTSEKKSWTMNGIVTDDKKQEGNRGFSGLESICSVTLCKKAVSWIYILPLVVKFSFS